MIIKTFTLIAIVAAMLACPALAQELCHSQAQIWLDGTGSVVPTSVNETAFQAIQTLAQLPAAQRLCRIDLYQFTDQAIHATPFHRVQLPTSAPPECNTVKVSGELGWFKGVNKTAEAKTSESCKMKRQEWDKQQGVLLQSELAKAQAAIRNRGKMPGQCTALTDVAQRLARTPSPNVKLAVIVSDGIQSCTTNPGEAIASPRAPMKAFMVVMPNTVHRNDGISFNRIAANWRRLAPWINLVLPDELSYALRSK